MTKKFNNRQNEEIKVDGKTYWISRSVAVVGVHLAEHNDKMYVLVEKRSAKMDCPGKWAVVSGYLDWDESAYDAVLRETIEETGFDVLENRYWQVYNNNEEPIKVSSDPSRDARQNVTLIYMFVYEYADGLPLEVESFKNDEVDDVMWLDVELLSNDGLFSDPNVWAFHHDDVINNAIRKYNETFH